MKIYPFFYIFILFLYSCGSSNKSSIKISDHYDGKVFSNPWGNNNQKNFLDVIKWKLQNNRVSWPDEEVLNTSNSQLIEPVLDQNLRITFIGHSTFYLQTNSISILTDPQFSERASPISFIGPKRIRKPGIEIDKLPNLNYVIISHNHYDHLDLPSIKKLNQLYHPTFLVPIGNKYLLEEIGIEKIHELDWWENFEGFTLVPVQHWSQRGLLDKNESLWGGYVFELSKKKIFFGGDTGYGPHFKMIFDRLGPMDLSFLPIGAYEPRWFMKDQHLNPEEAVQAHLDLKTKNSIAIHFETFQMSDEAFLAPRETLLKEIKNKSLPDNSFWIPLVGETLLMNK